MGKSFYSAEYGHFRALIVAAREKSGLTQSEVAKKLKRPQSFVSKYESGERRLDLVEFLQICKVLAVNPEAIVGELKGRFGK